MAIVPISRDLHGKTRIRPFASFAFAARMTTVPVYGSEIVQMCHEVPVVFIIPAAGVAGAPPELHDTVMTACRSALADFKVPREIRFVDDMPRSTLEKVAKAELRKLLI